MYFNGKVHKNASKIQSLNRLWLRLNGYFINFMKSLQTIFFFLFNNLIDIYHLELHDPYQETKH